jgi:hypothetical protein
MHEYFFISNKITERQVKDIINQAGYNSDDYTYQVMVNHDGYVVQGNEPMAISPLEHAAKKLNIKVEISSTNYTTKTTAMADSTTYSCDFQNDTPDTWTFCVYQTLPSSPGIQSVAWKQTTVPQSGESGVEWNISYLACLLNYRQSGGKGVYKASQKLTTNLGTAWKAVFENSSQQLLPDGSAPQKNMVLIKNKSGQLADLGFGMDGDVSMVKSNVYSDNSAQFIVEPMYWVALFKDLVKGEVISGNQIHGPLPAKFLGGFNNLSYRAWIEGETFNFKEEKSGQLVSAPLSEMQTKINIINSRRTIQLAH